MVDNTENEEVLGGFSPMDIISKSLRSDVENDKVIIGGSLGDDDFDVPDEVDKKIKDALESDDDNDEDTNEETEEAEDKDKSDNEGSDDDSKTNTGLDPDMEQDVVDFFLDKFTTELDFTFDDETKPKSIKDIIGYIDEMVQEASKPVYPSSEVEELAEFVKNGGNIRNFIENVYTAPVELDKLDLDDETNQELVVSQNLRIKGFKEEAISKKIKRYKELGTLYDEAEESVPELKEYEDKTKALLLEKKQSERVAREQAQLEFITTVENNIKEIDNINGIKLNPKEKAELREYMLKVGPDGKTAYQKDYQSNIANFIKSAYYTKKGDAFTKQLNVKAETEAAKKLRDRLEASRGKRSKNQNPNDRSEKSPDLFRMFSSQYINKK